MRLLGAVVLVTGASSGIGEAVAQRLAAAGSVVLAAGRDEDRLARLARRTGATPLAADLAVPGAAADLAEQALARHGHVDVLVNNAGVGWAGPFVTMPAATAAAVLDVNLRAPVELTAALLPTLRRRRGHVVYVASIAGRLGVAGEAVYAASKAGLDVFATSLRHELAPDGVSVSVVVPGVVDTDFFARRGRPYDRRRPRPLPVSVAADAVVDAIVHRRAEVYRPRWLRLPVAVRAALPGLYRRLAGRFG
jgi:short-subunit dehydrogenase